ncbi:roadblock/LC7 domain-containing protein [Demequina zhanjiangensis]|uniref:Roadblock/LC7 domain-containing protein n=1 Tax=Demequina zhanjiangensis TaxID=3051659 RepID=A0ABT8G4W4_9MICO|nr:roadblock/LC7 domain-containing protein [Demequina sp. SYSU T00b26]MDN4474176.1 roadblock/LC7 domain-containing protein [Demequina sp. SYSU T00b26]
MIVAKHGLLAAARLRKQVDGIRRVVIARTDGIALYDDVPLEQRDGAAALTAAVLGLADTSSASLDLDEVQFTFTMGAQGSLFVVPVDHQHLLAIVAEAGVDTVALASAAQSEIAVLRRLAGPAMAVS